MRWYVIVVVLVSIFHLISGSAYGGIIPCPKQKRTGDVFSDNPNKKCAEGTTQIQGYSFPAGAEFIFDSSGRIKAAKLPKDSLPLEGVKWSQGWISFSAETGKVRTGELREPTTLSNGATLGTEWSITVSNGKITSGKLAKPYTFKGFHFPAGVRILFYLNGNVREGIVDQESQSIHDPDGSMYGPPASIHFSEDGKFTGSKEMVRIEADSDVHPRKH